MNKEKSDIYLAGMSGDVKEAVLRYSGLKLDTFPFRYLGIPTQTKKLSITDCACLVDKITARISSFCMRKLSYAGRITLVNSVLISLHAYWANIFVLPKAIIDRITSVCRNYLWDGRVEGSRVPLVAWDLVCKPKMSGGLGLKLFHQWNVACVSRFSWWLFSGKDRLWLKWVNEVYLKGQSWLSYQPPADSSWYWRKLCFIRDKSVGCCSAVAHRDFEVGACYDSMVPGAGKLPWPKLIWHKFVVPNYTSICWLFCLQRVRLKDKLHSLGVCLDNVCVLCSSAVETHGHLFMDCPYSSRCTLVLAQKLQCTIPCQNTFNWCMKRTCRSRLKKVVCNAAVCGLVYHLWLQRNTCRLENKLLMPDFLVSMLIKDVKTRIMSFDLTKFGKADFDWLMALEIVGPYVVALKELGSRVLQKISQGFGLERVYFKNELSEDNSLSVNHYPICPNPSMTIGLPMHIDPTLINVVHAPPFDVPGLQLLRNGQWFDVEMSPNTLLVFIGSQLEVMFNF